jgi:hypothetical protein
MPPVVVVEPTPIANLVPTAMSTLHGESPLAAELHLIGDAQSALRGGDAERSLALLGEHDQRFPSGALAPEAAVLRVDALCTAGRVSDAESARQHFEMQYPGSPLTRALASSCARGAAR